MADRHEIDNGYVSRHRRRRSLRTPCAWQLSSRASRYGRGGSHGNPSSIAASWSPPTRPSDKSDWTSPRQVRGDDVMVLPHAAHSDPAQYLSCPPRLRLPQRRAGRRRKLDWIRMDMVGTGLPVPLVTRLATRPCRRLCPLVGVGPALPHILTITFNAVLPSIAAYPSGTPRRPTVMSKTGDGSSVPARTSSISSSM